jgi:hypothetical protein
MEVQRLCRAGAVEDAGEQMQMQVCRCAGVQVCRCVGVQVCKYAGVHVLGCRGAEVEMRCRDAEQVQWCSGVNAYMDLLRC